MKCVRCQQEIPEFMFVDGSNGLDHLVLTDHPPTIYRDDLFGKDEIKFSMHVYAQRRFCSSMYLLTEAGLVEIQEPVVYAKNSDNEIVEIENVYSEEVRSLGG